MTEDIQDIIASSDELDSVGFVQLPLLVLFDKRLSSGDKILYCILKRFSRDKGLCFPGLARLSKAMGVNQRTVQRHLETLEMRGLIRRKRRPSKSNIYDLGTFREVYGEGQNCNRIKDDALLDLKESGEDKVVDWVEKTRKLFLELDDSGSKDPIVDPEEKEASPPPEKKRTKRTMEEALAAAKAKNDKTDKALERKRERRAKLAKERKKPKPVKVDETIDELFDKNKNLSLRDLEEEYRLTVQEKFPDKTGLAAAWGGKQFKQVQTVVGNFEKEGIERKAIFCAFIETIQRWEQFLDAFGQEGYPNVGFIVSFCYSWFPVLWNDGAPKAESKREKARKKRDWNPDHASKDEKEGGLSFL